MKVVSKIIFLIYIFANRFREILLLQLLNSAFLVIFKWKQFPNEAFLKTSDGLGTS